MRPFIVGSLLLFAATLDAQRPSASTAVPISPMRQLYVQDQRDRGVLITDAGEAPKPGEVVPSPPNMEMPEVTRRDEERRKTVRVMIDGGKLVSGQDFHDAAFIFQHGQSADDYLLAHILAIEAVVRGDTGSKWIAAATLDRYLQEIGQKQVFGTQYLDTQLAYYYEHRNDADVTTKFKEIPSRETQQPYNETLLPPLMRRDFCVPDLAEQRKYITLTNAGKSAILPRTSHCVR